MEQETQSKRVMRPFMALIMIAITGLVIVAMVVGVSWLAGNSRYWGAPDWNSSAANTQLGGFYEEPVATMTPGGPLYTPTPDAPHALPPIRTKTETYTVRSGDSLGSIAQQYGISLEKLIQDNDIANPNILEVGQVLTVPVATPDILGPGFKVIPDSELVYGPTVAGFDVAAFIQSKGGYLATYTEEVNDRELSGARILELLAQNHSVNPRLLLAVLEHRSGWVTNPNPAADALETPIGDLGPNARGLYRQLNWAANQLNLGFYLWRVNGTATWLLGDGSVVPINSTINAGTAAVQQFFAPLTGLDSWTQAVTDGGLITTFTSLFGYPFNYSFEPLLPGDLQQPTMQLPIEDETIWSFTGGPHGGWGTGSGWAALDFAPPGNALGCVLSDEWVVAVADGQILRTGDGAVIQELDDDGFEGTGWVVLYMHVETRDRVEPGTTLKAGNRIGHPSCEGGVSSGTHVHIARKYNGEWIPADQELPFNLDGWISSGAGQYYDGYLTRGNQVIEAYAGREATNAIQR
jgi:murein DD-endopeptidase MepM/ murein hydrolase activator NlpD